MKIALDVDDVLAAFTPHAHRYYGHELSTCNYWCVKTMDAKFGEGWFNQIAPIRSFWDTLPVLTDPSEITFEIDCYMSAFPLEMYDSRMNWLARHGFPQKPLIVTFNKLEACLEMGIDVLVDDKPAMMELLKDSPVKGIHFLPHYAGFEPVGEHVTSLKQVSELL